MTHDTDTRAQAVAPICFLLHPRPPQAKENTAEQDSHNNRRGNRYANHVVKQREK